MSGRQNNSSANPPKTGLLNKIISRFSQYIPSRKTRASNKIEPSNSPPLSQLSQISQLSQLPASRLSRLRPLPSKLLYDLDLRIQKYKLIQETLKELNKNDQDKLTKYTCLEKNYDNNTYYIKDIIILDKRIGSQSVNGAIYKTVIKGNHINIATKVMESSMGNKLETKLMKAITDKIILTKKSRHFVIMYCYSFCIALARKQKDYALANFNEYANNDIEYLLQQEEILTDEKLLHNLLIQAFISIGTFHNFTGYIHSDCHLRNFLYIDNTKSKGYYHYTFDNKSYYLKSCKYNVMINDFGLSENIGMDDENLMFHILGIEIIINRENTGKEYSDDKIVSIVNHIKQNFQWYKARLIINDYIKLLYNLSNIKNIHSNILIKINIIIDKLDKLKLERNNDLLKQILAIILDICIEQFKAMGIFTDKLPEGSIIINDQSFELYSKTKLDIALPDI